MASRQSWRLLGRKGYTLTLLPTARHGVVCGLVSRRVYHRQPNILYSSTGPKPIERVSFIGPERPARPIVRR